MTDYERLTDIFMDVLPEDNPFHGRVKNLVEELLANGVTFATDNNVGSTPVAPDYDYEYRISEMSYNNGYAKGLQDGKPKWIPVEERLPTPYVDVITCRRDYLARGTTIGKEYIGTISDNEIPSWSQDYWTWKSKVTHWMPLPEPPK